MAKNLEKYRVKVLCEDKLAFVFRKRNINTWIAWVQDGAQDKNISEDDDYKYQTSKLLPGKSGKYASDLFVKSLNDPSVCLNAPNALKSAYEDYKNLIEKL